jgi:hypothetical protein
VSQHLSGKEFKTFSKKTIMESSMLTISKTCIVYLLISLFLSACRSGGGAGSGRQTLEATVSPAPIGYKPLPLITLQRLP